MLDTTKTPGKVRITIMTHATMEQAQGQAPVRTLRKPKPGMSLAERFPEVAAEWHPTKNGDITPQDVSAGSKKKYWFRCGPHKHEWVASLNNRTRQGSGCPYCAGKRVLPGYNDLATTHPEVAAEWHPTKNGSVTPQDVIAGSDKKYWFRCGPHKHEWVASLDSRTGKGSGCPYCAGQRVLPGYNDLATTHPEVAAEWHPTKNGDITPQDVHSGSPKKYWFRCGPHRHEWLTRLVDRTGLGSGCPYCAGKRVLPGYNDLATTHPEIADEWHPTKNGDITPQDVHTGSNKKYWFRCGPHKHEWVTRLNDRTRLGSGCPTCACSNTSKIEQAFTSALAESGIFTKHALNKELQNVRYPSRNRRGQFSRGAMEPDFYGVLPDGTPCVFEYDGAYWHAANGKDHRNPARDLAKTQALLDAGIKVVRVRDDDPQYPLGLLPIQHPNLLQIMHVHGDDIAPVVEQVLAFFQHRGE